jgi:hypothetical protein
LSFSFETFVDEALMCVLDDGGAVRMCWIGEFFTGCLGCAGCEAAGLIGPLAVVCVRAYGRGVRSGAAGRGLEGCGREDDNDGIGLFGRSGVGPDVWTGVEVKGIEGPDFMRAANKACVSGFAIDTLLYCCGWWGRCCCCCG